MHIDTYMATASDVGDFEKYRAPLRRHQDVALHLRMSCADRHVWPIGILPMQFDRITASRAQEMQSDSKY